MDFVYDDGGRKAASFKGTAGDCVVRAVAIASGLPYLEVYAALSDGIKTQRKTRRSNPRASARDGVNTKRKWFRDYMASIGFAWTPTMHIGVGCTVHLHDGELPMGRLVVAVSKHYTAVIGGVIHDTHDPQRNVTTFHKFPGWEDVPLKPGQSRNVNGVYSTARRCVYGYWQS